MPLKAQDQCVKTVHQILVKLTPRRKCYKSRLTFKLQKAGSFHVCEKVEWWVFGVSFNTVDDIDFS